MTMTGWDTFVRAALCSGYRYTGAMHLHERLLQWCGQQFMAILLFHRVTDAIPEDGLTVSTGRFRRICELLAGRFRVVPLGEIFRILREGDRIPPRTVAITFDDCYRDNLDAARVLHEFGLPATFLIPAGFIGSSRIFDWDRGLPAMPNLTWDDVRAMTRMGFEIGSHSLTHSNLGAVSSEQVRMELTLSKSIIEDHIGQPVRWFAYPFGGQQHIKPEYVPLIREAGYEGALSAFGGFVWPGMEAHVLPREAVPSFRSLAHLEVYLAGCLNWLYALKGRQPHHIRDPWPYGDHALARREASPASRECCPALVSGGVGTAPGTQP